jgi:hypothetical protein
MSDIADKIYAATGLTLSAEAAAKVGHMIRLARLDGLEKAVQYHEKLAAAKQQMAETPVVDEFYTAVWKASAEQHRHYADAIRALGEKE